MHIFAFDYVCRMFFFVMHIFLRVTKTLYYFSVVHFGKRYSENIVETIVNIVLNCEKNCFLLKKYIKYFNNVAFYFGCSTI